MFIIKFKQEKSVDKLNQLLEAYGISGGVISDKDNKKWLEDINTNPDSSQKHLKPTDRDLSIEELKEMFPAWTETYRFDTDLYFGRTPEKEMKSLASLIKKHKNLIEYIDGSDLLIERGDIEETYHEVLKGLEKPVEERKKLPKEKQTTDELQSGVLLCKSWSNTKFWVAFGAVDRPQFMKKKIYEEYDFNNLYKTKDGYAVMLLPLLILGKPNHLNEIFKGAWEIGLREHPAYFNTIVYDASYISQNDIEESLAHFYTEDELSERLDVIHQRIIANNYHRGEGKIINEKNKKPYVEGTNRDQLYQTSKEKRAWDYLTGAMLRKSPEDHKLFIG
jgi:hypothetical protein